MIPIVKDYMLKNTYILLGEIVAAITLTLAQGINIGQSLLLISLGPFAIPLAYWIWPQPLWVWYVLLLIWITTGSYYFKMKPTWDDVKQAKYPVFGDKPE